MGGLDGGGKCTSEVLVRHGMVDLGQCDFCCGVGCQGGLKVSLFMQLIVPAYEFKGRGGPGNYIDGTEHSHSLSGGSTAVKSPAKCPKRYGVNWVLAWSFKSHLFF